MNEKTKNNKRKNDEKESSTIENKKTRSLSVKELRKKLNTEERLTAFLEFLQGIKNSSDQDYILEFLENGGNCIELLQIMENNPDVSPVVVFEIVSLILLNIIGKYPQFSNLAHDTGRYILNTYTTLIHKMLGLSSTTQERIIVLKLLTAIATFSAVLAKDILIHIDFHQTNLELLTKNTEQKNEVRDVFIHFLIAFLVSGQYPTLSVLLEKRGLITSIVGGLQYDECDTVCLVLTSMRNHILENPQVSKTMKMKTFNTTVIKSIINLYNWKGPTAIPSKKKGKTIEVDLNEKSKVNEAVHDFLLILCTSHKYGIVFKDHHLGLGKMNQNKLILTVLENLDKPWEHSYASDLVIKICGACPELTKTIWMNLKGYLEPRATEKWLNTVKFTEKLLDELGPSCIEYCVKDLTENQLPQVITALVTPFPVIRAILPETPLDDSVKVTVLNLLLKMLKSLEIHMKSLKIWLKNTRKLEKFIKSHVSRNFPDSAFILNNCFNADDKLNYLNVAIDLLEYYKIYAYQLLNPLSSLVDVDDFLKEITKFSSDNKEKFQQVQIKCIKFFIDFQPILFGIKTNLFKFVTNLLFKFYSNDRSSTTFNVIFNLFKLTNSFDKDFEINFWINGILNTSYDESICDFIVETLKESDLKPIKVALKQNITNKKIKRYLEFVLLNLFHTQSNDLDIFEDFNYFKNLNKYIENWKNNNIEILHKINNWELNIFSDFSLVFLCENNENFNEFIKKTLLDLYPDCKLNLLQQAMFYFTNLFKFNKLTEIHFRNLQIFLDYLNNDSLNPQYLNVLFSNSIIIKNISLTESNYCTKLIMDFLKKFKISIPDEYLHKYQKKLFKSIIKLFKKLNETTTYNGILDVISLNESQSLEIIENAPNLNDPNPLFTKIIFNCLNCINTELNNECFNKILKYCILLFNNHYKDSGPVAESLMNYLKNHLSQINNIPEELVNALMNFSEPNQQLIDLICYLLENNETFFKLIELNLDKINERKSLLLNILNVVIKKECNDEILKKIYDKFEGNIIKAIQKPQKANQYFHTFYYSIGVLIEKFMPQNKYNINKIQKFDTCQLFHIYLLDKIFNKFDKKQHFDNMIMTFIHLIMILLKTKNNKNNQDDQSDNLFKISEIFHNFLLNLDVKQAKLNKNETFNVFCKFCLKYGVSGDYFLLKILNDLLNVYSFNENEAKLILDLLLSHSEFLEIVLNDFHDNVKLEVLSLFSVLCKKWPQFMERSHVPIILASYKGTLRSCDKILLDLLKRCEENANQTKFFDFKPFLWGKAAASHYSVRTDIQKALWRQPKMVDVMNILQDNYVLSTIKNFPQSNENLEENVAKSVYDLTFLLPLFSQLLAPQNAVQTYHFTKSGALSLTILGLGSYDKDCRLAACHVLSRFHYHLEARQTGKDNPLWIRFIEAICRGITKIDSLKLNNFSAIYLARMALILTQPNHIMYVPLTQYLLAKSSLDFNSIPELYTFLNSSDINYKEHRNFILEVICDGLKTNKDFSIVSHSMAFKLLSGLALSSLCDTETKLLILDIFHKCCFIPLGLKNLCENHSFLAQLFVLHKESIKYKEKNEILNKIKEIFQLIGLKM